MGHEQGIADVFPLPVIPSLLRKLIPWKDFGANGLRIGSIISQHNEAFNAALRTDSYVQMNVDSRLPCNRHTMLNLQ